MKHVFKYKIDPNARGIPMPLGAEVLHVHMQGDDAYVWARVDTRNITVKRILVVESTGAAVPDHAKYVGTIGPDNYRLVFHVFDIGEEAT